MRLVASLSLVLVVAHASPAIAQPSRGTVFISGAAFAAIENEPSFGGLGQPARDSSATVAGGALAIGVHLTERISARFEWSLTDGLRRKTDYSYPAYLYSPELPAAFSAPGGFFPIDQFPRTFPASSETKRTTSAGFALLGYHLTAGRASVELLGGLGLINTDVTTSYDDRIARGLGFSLPLPSNSRSIFDAVAVVGADVAVSLTAHAAIVPQVRAYARAGGLSMRPGLALRWTF